MESDRLIEIGDCSVVVAFFPISVATIVKQAIDARPFGDEEELAVIKLRFISELQPDSRPCPPLPGKRGADGQGSAFIRPAA
jgi:hypothetical protein